MTRALGICYLAAALLSGVSGAAACEGQVILLEDHFDTLSKIWESPNALALTEGALTVAIAAGKSGEVLATPKYGDVDACVDVSVSEGSRPEETYPGLVFWAADLQNLYSLEISLDGDVSVYRRRAGKWASVVADQPSPALKTGLDAVNTLRVVTSGPMATFYVNGTEVGQLKGQPPAGGQRVGFTMTAPEDTAATFRVDNVKVTAPQ